jgi:hypothetical protein
MEELIKLGEMQGVQAAERQRPGCEHSVLQMTDGEDML